MFKSSLLASTAVGLLLCTVPASAQMDKAPPEKMERGAPSQAQQPSKAERAPAQAPGGQVDRGQDRPEGKAPRAERPEGTGKDMKSTQDRRQQAPDKGTAQKGDRDDQGSRQKRAEPREKAPEKSEAREKSTDRTREKAAEPKQPKDKATGRAEDKRAEPKDKAASQPQQGKDKAERTQPKDKSAEKSTKGQDRVRISDQQRTNVRESLLKQTNVNRVTNVNFSIRVGTRIPRSVRLVALPAAVIEVVPEYRSYHYVVVRDEICIVDPNTYEIVAVLDMPSQTASRPGGSATLVLTDEERLLISREIEIDAGSTLALGALTVGSDVPRGVEVHVFPDRVVERVPKVKGYKFFAAENRIAIVDPQGAHVQLVIEKQR